MDKQQIIDYIMHTPSNTNPAMLGQFLDEYGGGNNDFSTATITFSRDLNAREVQSFAVPNICHINNIETTADICYDLGSSATVILYKGQAVKEVFDKDPSYYTWIMQGDFTLNTKQELKKIKLMN